MKKKCVSVTEDGPYYVTGGLGIQKEIVITGKEGEPVRWGKGAKIKASADYCLCRCGHSKTKPFCDSSHVKAGFKGKETATMKKYLSQAEKTRGPGLLLTDAPSLCSATRFCHLLGGTWKLTEKSGDKKSKAEAIREACSCPSGRLVAWDRKKPIEPKFAPSISLIEDPGAHVSGPIWVKGGVQVISAAGKKYEIRNRVTLCRCGHSTNKPFCDGSHMDIGFNDGDRSIKGAERR